MKTTTPALSAAAASCLAALLLLGCSQNNNANQAEAVSISAPLPTTAVPSKPAPVANVGPAATVAPDTGSFTWADIENMTFGQRSAFMAGFTSLVRKLDGQISALTAKRATMTTGTDDWDFAMKEVNASRTYLVGLEGELASASPDTWGQEKDKVGGAWRRAQDACDKVRMSTTS
jgi:hypothetical protein